MRVSNFLNYYQPIKFKATKNKAPLVISDNVVADKKQEYLKYLIPIGMVLAAGIGIKCFCSRKVALEPKIENEASNYVKELASSLSKWLNKDIDANSLKSVISGEELLLELQKLEKQNFVASVENIQKGIFCADLHSHSLHSDGLANVDKILNQVVSYADDLNVKTGKKFIFSLTDHDSCEGVKEALKIISENPEKFENVKFVTGVELSFLIKADKTANPFETSEMLVYGFNPFDEKVQNYFQNLYSKRKKMVTNYIQDLNNLFGYADFSLEEFNKIYGKNYMMNYQWKVHNYGQTKNAVSGLAISQNKDKSVMYEEIMSKTDRWKKMLHNLREKNLIPASYGEDTRITDLCRNKYSPKWFNGKIDYASEVNFEEIAQTFGTNKNTFGAFAHPYYITERNSNAQILINDLVRMSNGFIKAAESHHQAYKSSINPNDINQFNEKIIYQNKLLELGGRDNHDVEWLKK